MPAVMVPIIARGIYVQKNWLVGRHGPMGVIPRLIPWGVNMVGRVSSVSSGPQPWFTHMSQVKDPSMSIVFSEETDPRTENQGTWVIDVKPNPRWVDQLAVFHGNDSSFGFADGHSENHRWVKDLTLKTARDSAGGNGHFYWGLGTAKNPDFKWVYDRYKHKKWSSSMILMNLFFF